MEIITDVPKYHDGEVARKFLREIVQGNRLRRFHEAKKRDQEASRWAAGYRKKHTESLGRCVTSINIKDWFDLRNKYGIEAMSDEGFLKDLQRFHPEVAPNKL